MPVAASEIQSPSMLERYHIINEQDLNEQDLAAAVAKRYGTVMAQFAPSTAVPSR